MLKLQKKNAERYFKRLNEEDLISRAEHIQSLCINKKTVIDYGIIEWEHHLPFVNKNKKNHIDNWDLTAKEKSMIKDTIKDLKEYAKNMIILYDWYDIEIIDYFLILPPWLVFPLYPANAIGWKKGLGQLYKRLYFDILHSMDERERRVFTKDFPVPKYFSEMYYGMNIQGINMIEEGSLLL